MGGAKMAKKKKKKVNSNKKVQDILGLNGSP